jgi:hypothetical protein
MARGKDCRLKVESWAAALPEFGQSGICYFLIANNLFRYGPEDHSFHGKRMGVRKTL